MLLLIESGLVIRHNEISILFKVIPNMCVCGQIDNSCSSDSGFSYEINVPTTSGTFVVCTYK